MAGTVLYLHGRRDHTAECLAQSARNAGIAFQAVEMGWTDTEIVPRVDEIRNAARDRIPPVEIAGLLAGDRVSAICAAYLAERSGVRFHPVEAMETCTQRLLARECLKSAGLPVAEAFLISSSAAVEDAIHRTGFPCVLKPVRFTGGQGVFRVDTPDEFHSVFNRLREMTGGRPGEQFMVEEYIRGDEIEYFGFASSWLQHALGLFDKTPRFDSRGFEECLISYPTLHPKHVASELVRTAERAAAAMRLTDGPVSVEMRWDGQRAVVLEVNPFLPPPAICQALDPRDSDETGQALLRAAAGVAKPRFEIRQAAGVGYVPLPGPGTFERLEGVEEALRVRGAGEVVACLESGQTACPPPEGNHRAGYVTARGVTAEDVRETLAVALSALSARMARPASSAG